MLRYEPKTKPSANLQYPDIGRKQSTASVAAGMMTVTEAAKTLGVGEITVRKACDNGQIPCVRVQSRYLIPREKFGEWYMRQVNCTANPQANENVVRDILTTARIEQLMIQLAAIHDELRRLGLPVPVVDERKSA